VVQGQKKRGRKRATEEAVTNETNVKNTGRPGRRGRKRLNEKGERNNAKRSRTTEDTENVQRNSELTSVETTTIQKGGKGGGRESFKGVLTYPKGLEWLENYENGHKKNFKPQSTVCVQTTQGPIVLDDRALSRTRVSAALAGPSAPLAPWSLPTS